MPQFLSPLAETWVFHLLHYLEHLERLANSIPEEGFAWRVAGAGRNSRSIGELLQEAGMTVCFSIGATVEIMPAMEDTVSKPDALAHLLKAREAIYKWGVSLSEDAVSRPRTTVLHPTKSTFVEQMVVLIAQVNRMLGQIALIARLNGHVFDLSKPSNHPLPYGPEDQVPGLERPGR